MTSPYQKLNDALVQAGVPAKIRRTVKGVDLETEGAINVLVNSRIDTTPFANILLQYAPQLTDPNQIEMVARCMMQPKGFRDAVPWLLSLFNRFPQNGLTPTHLWAVGSAIHVINHKKFYPEVIDVCRSKKYGGGRQMLMGTLARAKTDTAYEVLVNSLEDPTVRAHAIEGLGRFGRTDAIPLLLATPVEEGHFESKAKATALRRLRRKL